MRADRAAANRSRERIACRAPIARSRGRRSCAGMSVDRRDRPARTGFVRPIWRAPTSRARSASRRHARLARAALSCRASAIAPAAATGEPRSPMAAKPPSVSASAVAVRRHAALDRERANGRVRHRRAGGGRPSSSFDGQPALLPLRACPGPSEDGSSVSVDSLVGLRRSETTSMRSSGATGLTRWCVNPAWRLRRRSSGCP